MADELCLKWGTLKAWNFTGNEKAKEALRRYYEDPTSFGAMQQRDTPAQKQAICDMIDAVNCTIMNDWTGEEMTKEGAKEYVLGYER